MSIQLKNADWLAQKALAQALQPPPPVDFEQWAIDNLVFGDVNKSAVPGPYNAKLFAPFSEIYKALGPDDPCRIVTLQKSVQVGGTIAANVFTLGTLDMAPCDFLYVHPTEDNARRWSKLKLQPMLRSLPSLARQFPEKSRDGGDSVLFKQRVDGRGSILVSGANSPASLSQVSMPRQVQDDLAKWEMNNAGDPETQADSRSEAFQFAKIFKISSPMVMPGCRITTNYQSGSQEELQIPCPHCDTYQVLDWGNMQAATREDDPDDAHFTCIECGCEIREHHRRTWAGKERWVAQNPGAASYHRSFRLWGVYLPLQSWPQLFRRWLAAKGDPAREQAFTNDVVGLAWEIKGDAPPWEELRDRAEASSYKRGQVPAGALVLTLGCDCQKDRVEWQLVGFGSNGRRWVIERGIVHHHIAEPDARAELDKLITTRWRNSAGREMTPDMTAIDGNAWTEDVWQWVKRHPSNKVIMVRGVPSEAAPLLARVNRERNPRTGKPLKYSRRFFNFATSVLKMALYRNVRKTDAEEFGYVGFPAGLEDDYFEQLTAESRVPKKRRDGFVEYRWHKDPNTPNEMLDTMLQAEAAFIRLGGRTMTDGTWERLAAERETPPDDPQLDFEELPIASRQTAAAGSDVNSPAKRVKVRKMRFK